MRLFFTSLIAGGCLLAGATVATADEIRLDDAALDNVSAGYPAIENRRSALLGFASLALAQEVASQYNAETGNNALLDPTVGPIVLTLGTFGVSQLVAAGPQAIALWF